MEFSYRWIQELVPGLNVAAHELEKLITVRTAECEGIHPSGELLAHARVGRVLTAQPEPDTHLTRATVDVGASDPVTVACGAPNCRAGMRTIWVPLGRKMIGGIESNGMLASPQELGLSRDHSGIIEWNDATFDLTPDQIIEIDNKSLTHRPDLWGHLGIAREVAAITRNELRDPVAAILPGGSDSYDIRVDDFDLCPRFSTVVFENVQIRPSPWWLQYRLTSIGLNPINNIVDITNYVMAELAQPLHAFDREKLRGDRLIVRRARSGETLAALNDETYTLDPSNVVVADSEGAVSIAGVIGGRGSAILDSTSSIVFESANWKASSIRRTSSALKIRTDASMRFEKSQDPANTVRALARAIALMKIVCPEARLAGRLTDVYECLPKSQIIRLQLDAINKKLGRVVAPLEVREILERLAFQVREAGQGLLEVVVPSWRATKDVSGPDDLVEEVGRMVGYDSIAPTPPLTLCSPPPDNPERAWLRAVRGRMTARGYTEVYNYSFLSGAQAARFHLSAAGQVAVLNPIASDQNLLRSSLIPGIFANIELNAKHFRSFRLFEIGREIHNQSPALPSEVTRLVAAIFANEGDGKAGLFELKRIIDVIVRGTRVEPVSDTLPYEHPARTSNVLLETSVVGRLFEAHPDMVESGRAAILDLNLDRIFELGQKVTEYKPAQRFPTSSFDLSFMVPVREFAASIETRIREFAGPLLQSSEYVREYSGPQVPTGMKSVTYRLTLGVADRTLSSEEATEVRSRVIEEMHRLGYEMRI